MDYTNYYEMYIQFKLSNEINIIKLKCRITVKTVRTKMIK